MRRGVLSAALLVAAFVLLAPTAHAAEEGGGGGALLNVDIWTVVTSLVVFVLLLFVLSKTAWNPILQGLQRREAAIKKALDDAQEAHTKAKELIAEYEGRIQNAREEAQDIFDEARRDAQDIRANIETEARKRADETIERARREIDQLTAKAWDGLVNNAANIATEAASRIIRKDLTDEGHAGLVSEVVSEFGGLDGPKSGGTAS